ncbi:MAG: hypothetical protein WBF05_05055, partial [Anaerolineales bacterium]
MGDKLEITALGGLSIKQDGEPITGLASRKAEALLVYLACTGKPQSREKLAELLWEERSQSRSLSNLRVVLSSLRKHLGKYITITRDTVTLNQAADIWLDTADLEEKLAAGQPEAAVSLYKGDFLGSFYLRGAAQFEQWVMEERARLH